MPARLCAACALRLAPRTPQRDEWFCPACRADVVSANLGLGVALVPVDPAASPPSAGPAGAAPWERRVLARDAPGHGEASRHLEEWHRRRVGALLGRLGRHVPRSLPLAVFLERCGADGDPERARAEAVDGLLRWFGVHRGPGPGVAWIHGPTPRR